MECKYCLSSDYTEPFNEHFAKCYYEQIKLFNNDVSSLLTPIQKHAVEFSLKKSKIIQKNVKLNVLEKFIKLDYDENDLMQTEYYIKNDCQIIIHFNVSIIDNMINDGVYKNIFEVKVKDGKYKEQYITPRINAENIIFKGIYDKSEAFERPKYGSINITKSPSGIASCYSYGNSYMILNNYIKNRASFIHGDSFGLELHLASFGYPIPILNLLSITDLKTVIDIATGKKQSAKSLDTYLEVQIHGPIRFKQDVKELKINKLYRQQDIINKLDLFSQKYGCPYSFF